MMRSRTRTWLTLGLAPLALLLAGMMCGGNDLSGAVDMTVQPENMVIAGLPQYICPTSTPRPTSTQPATVVQATQYTPPSSYATYTPVPGCVWNGTFCATHTPFPGGGYTTPGWTGPGPTSTPRSTHTPWPTPTPYVSTFEYHFDDDVYTQGVAATLDLRLRVGNIRVSPSARPGQQAVAYEVQIENRGPVFYFAVPAVQIYVAEVDDESGFWFANGEAAQEAGIALAEAATDSIQVNQGETVVFDLVAYTPVGEVSAVAWILDPYGNSFDGNIAGGNVAYWRAGERADCVGNVDGGVIVPTPATPDPTATPTATSSACVGLACATTMP